MEEEDKEKDKEEETEEEVVRYKENPPVTVHHVTTIVDTIKTDDNLM